MFLTVTAGMEGSMHSRAVLNVNAEVPDVASPPAREIDLESDWMRNDSEGICDHVTATALIPAWFKCWAVARVSAPQSGVI